MKNIEVKKLTKEEFEDFILMKKIEDTSLEEITELLLNQSYLVMFWQQVHEQQKEEIERLKDLCDKYEEEHKTTFEEWKKAINIIKEVRERLMKANIYRNYDDDEDDTHYTDLNIEELLEILDKENNNE